MKKQRKLKKGLALLLAMAMVVGPMSAVGSIKASAATAADGYDENGFCTTYSDGACSNENHTSCNGYQPAEVVSESHCPDLNNDFSGYYAIENAGQLYWFADKVNGGDTGINAVLVADITVNTGVLDADGKLASDTSSFVRWTPIGKQAGEYIGTFDGQGHTISGLYYNTSGQYRIGFFGAIKRGGIVSNVGIVNSYIKASTYTGGVCGDNKGTIKNCYYTGMVSGGETVGGVCGTNSGTIANCYSTGSVSGSGFIGGVCGYSQGTIRNCYSTGSVSGSKYIGGVCGSKYSSSSSTITNCYYEIMASIPGGINGADVTGQAEGKDAGDFHSGKLAYQLSQGTDGSIWGQDLSTDTNHPVLGGAKVYQTTPCISYTNDANGVKNHVDADGDACCDSCGEALGSNTAEKLEGYTLSLNGNIGVNFYMSLPDEMASNENAYMEFTLPNTAEKTKVYVTGTHEDGATATTSTVGGKTYYVFSCEVAAKEMTDEIQAQMIVGEDKGTLYTYTVKDYADYILDNAETYGDKVVALVKAMLNYGAYSQTYFDYQTAKLANADLAEADKALGDLTAEELVSYKPTVTKTGNDVCTFASAYLTLESETKMNIYVKFADGVDAESVLFSINNNQVSTDKLVKGTGSYEGYYKISMDNIQASALDDMHSFSIIRPQVGQAILTYGPMSYCYCVLASETASDNLKNVAKALYAFNQAANSYVAG